MSDKCRWEHKGYDHDFKEHDYDTECGEGYHLEFTINSSEIENYRYCPGCGKPIEEVSE